DLLHVLAVATVPGRGRDLLAAPGQDLVDLLDLQLVDDPSQAHGARVLLRDHDLHVVLQDPEDVKFHDGAGDLSPLDACHLRDTVSGVNDLVTDVELAHGAPSKTALTSPKSRERI